MSDSRRVIDDNRHAPTYALSDTLDVLGGWQVRVFGAPWTNRGDTYISVEFSDVWSTPTARVSMAVDANVLDFIRGHLEA